MALLNICIPYICKNETHITQESSFILTYNLVNNLTILINSNRYPINESDIFVSHHHSVINYSLTQFSNDVSDGKPIYVECSRSSLVLLLQPLDPCLQPLVASRTARRQVASVGCLKVSPGPHFLLLKLADELPQVWMVDAHGAVQSVVEP